MMYADLAPIFASSSSLKPYIQEAYPSVPLEDVERYASKYVEIFAKVAPSEDAAALSVAMSLDKELNDSIAAGCSIASLSSAPVAVHVIPGSITLRPRNRGAASAAELEAAELKAFDRMLNYSQTLEPAFSVAFADMVKAQHARGSFVMSDFISEFSEMVAFSDREGLEVFEKDALLDLARAWVVSRPFVMSDFLSHMSLMDHFSQKIERAMPEFHLWLQLREQAPESLAAPFGASAVTLALSSSGSLVRPASASGSEFSMRSVSPVTVATFMASAGATVGVADATASTTASKG